jgi:hypothetical protein
VRVAQLDRALGYGPRCRGFESSHARFFEGDASAPSFFISDSYKEKEMLAASPLLISLSI